MHFNACSLQRPAQEPISNLEAWTIRARPQVARAHQLLWRQAGGGGKQRSGHRYKIGRASACSRHYFFIRTEKECGIRGGTVAGVGEEQRVAAGGQATGPDADADGKEGAGGEVASHDFGALNA
jgi:hypothetical protein